MVHSPATPELTRPYLLSDHFGVVKAFLDAGLLPRVITGTSAGGLVAALVCTRTDEELKHLLRPELAHKISACSEPFKVWFDRFLKTGARFDSVQWASKVRLSDLSILNHTHQVALGVDRLVSSLEAQ